MKKNDIKTVRKQRNTSMMEKVVLAYTPIVNNLKSQGKNKSYKITLKI